MKHIGNPTQKPIEGITPYSRQCMSKIMGLLGRPVNEEEAKVAQQPDREPGSDDEPESAW